MDEKEIYYNILRIIILQSIQLLLLEVDWIGILGELAEGKEIYYKKPPHYGRDGYHLHHLWPKHMGGKDENGMIYLTYKDHALAHLKLWEEFELSGDLGAVKLVAKGACKDTCFDDVPTVSGELHWNWQGGISLEDGYDAARSKKFYDDRKDDPEFLELKAKQQRKSVEKRKALGPEFLKTRAADFMRYYNKNKDNKAFLARRAKNSMKSRKKIKAEKELRFAKLPLT